MNDFIVIIIYSVDKSQVFYSALSLSTIAKAVTSLALVLLIGGLAFLNEWRLDTCGQPSFGEATAFKGLRTAAKHGHRCLPVLQAIHSQQRMSFSILPTPISSSQVLEVMTMVRVSMRVPTMDKHGHNSHPFRAHHRWQ